MMRLQIASPMPVPGVLLPRVQPLEDHKYLLPVLLVDADAVVADGEFPAVPVAAGGDVNLRRLDRYGN